MCDFIIQGECGRPGEGQGLVDQPASEAAIHAPPSACLGESADGQHTDTPWMQPHSPAAQTRPPPAAPPCLCGSRPGCRAALRCRACLHMILGREACAEMSWGGRECKHAWLLAAVCLCRQVAGVLCDVLDGVRPATASSSQLCPEASACMLTDASWHPGPAQRHPPHPRHALGPAGMQSEQLHLTDCAGAAAAANRSVHELTGLQRQVAHLPARLHTFLWPACASWHGGSARVNRTACK